MNSSIDDIFFHKSIDTIYWHRNVSQTFETTPVQWHNTHTFDLGDTIT